MAREIDDISKRRKARERKFNGKRTTIDDYTKKKIHWGNKPNSKYKFSTSLTTDDDHVIPVKKVNKVYFDLSEEQRKKLANRDYNLAFVNSRLNRSKGELSNHEYLFRQIVKREPEDVTTTVNMLEREAKASVLMNAEATSMRVENVVDNFSQEVRDRTYSLPAIEGRLNTAKDTFIEYHEKSMETVKGAVVVASVMSGATNAYAVVSGEKSANEAVVDVAKDMATAGALSYGMSISEQGISHMLSCSGNEFLKQCSANNMVGMMAGSIIEVSKSLKRYAEDEIDEQGLVEELGMKGVGMLSSGYGLYVGTTVGAFLGSVIPGVGTLAGATIGSFVGPMVGYSVSAILYEGALKVLEEEKMSQKRYCLIRRIAEEAIEENNRYIAKLDRVLEYLRHDRRTQIETILCSMKKYIFSNDVSGYARTIEQMEALFNMDLQYKTFQEFDDVMSSNVSIIL